MKLSPGFYQSLSYAEYDQIDALRFSDLKYLERSPMAYKYHLDHPTEPTTPMILGNASHLAILEPSMVKFAVFTGKVRNGHVYDEWAKENAEKTQLNQKEYDHVLGMTRAVHANPVSHKYLRFVRTEVTAVWRYSLFGRDFKARFDALTDIDDETYLVSLKSTTDCRDFRFASQYVKMAYHVQDCIYESAYCYLNGSAPKMITIAYENKPPYESAVYLVGKSVLNQGDADLRKWMQRLNQCEAANRWPPAVEEETELVLPAWATADGDFSMDDLEPIER
jgi:hypothetical protein